MMKEIIESMKLITSNFEKGFKSSTCMGWRENYDLQGRLLNCNPNYRDGNIRIENVDYWYTRKEWKVRIWDKPSNYMDFMNDKTDYIAEVDLTPDYLKENE